MTNINNNDNPLIGYTPLLQESASPSSSSEEDVEVEREELKEQKTDEIIEEEETEKKTQIKKLMEVAYENIKILFKDQYEEAFARIFVKDHDEIIDLSSQKFTRFLLKRFYEKHGSLINSEAIKSVTQMLQAQAQFGDVKFDLTLRVAEYNEDLYYDLTNEKHQCVRISNDGTWEVIDRTPIPLFKRYNQTSQVLQSKDITDNKDQLEEFFSTLTNIKNREDRLIAKVAIMTWFIPDIPHFVLLIHGGKGSAKSMFLTLIKSIVDPAKPQLFTIHTDKSEFILTAFSKLCGSI